MVANPEGVPPNLEGDKAVEGAKGALVDPPTIAPVKVEDATPPTNIADIEIYALGVIAITAIGIKLIQPLSPNLFPLPSKDDDVVGVKIE